MTRPSLEPRLCRLLAGVLLFVFAGCDGVINRLTGGYAGPQPAEESLAGEVATVADVWTGYQGQIVLILDRAPYTESGDPHNVNRVIKAWTTAENQAEVAAMGLQNGDRVTLSTEFSAVAEGGGSMNVPNWPGHDALEYPIGSHRITAISRVAP